jgi:2-methylcitrate dehydratase PrpD
MLRTAHDIKPEQIERVTYGISNAGMLLVGKPADKKANPENVVDGQFSGPFVLACALATGAMGWESYRLLNDPVVRGLMTKISCEHDAEIEAEFPRNMSGKITIFAGGERFVQTVIVPKGEPANFLTEAELRTKFAALADAVLGADRALLLADAVLHLDTTSDISSLMRLAAPMMAARLAGD